MVLEGSLLRSTFRGKYNSIVAPLPLRRRWTWQGRRHWSGIRCTAMSCLHARCDIVGRNAAQRGFHPIRNPSTGWCKVSSAVPLTPAVPFCTRVSARIKPLLGRDSFEWCIRSVSSHHGPTQISHVSGGGQRGPSVLRVVPGTGVVYTAHGRATVQVRQII